MKSALPVVASMWQHPKDSKPPTNVKILIYLKSGIAHIGHWRDEDCLLWMPLPKVSKQLKERTKLETN